MNFKKVSDELVKRYLATSDIIMDMYLKELISDYKYEAIFEISDSKILNDLFTENEKINHEVNREKNEHNKDILSYYKIITGQVLYILLLREGQQNFILIGDSSELLDQLILICKN